jgi:lysozyme family protein
MKQLSYDEALAFYTSKTWEGMSAFDKARFQLSQKRLCMPFSVFEAAVNEAVGRKVDWRELVEAETLEDFM